MDERAVEDVEARPCVARCLLASPLRKARVVAGAEGLTRPVHWVSIVERPTKSSVGPGDFVLTTGADYDEQGLWQLVNEVAQCRAAALCVSVGTDTHVRTVPEKARELAGDAGMPLIEVPATVRLSEISRALIERIFFARYETKLGASNYVPPDFTEALLGHDGLALIARALEGMIARPVVILDSAFEVLTTSSTFDLDAHMRSGSCDEHVSGWICMDTMEAIPVPSLEARQLSGGVVAPAVAQGRTLGYVVVCDATPEKVVEAYEPAIRHASVAVAIETLRRRAAAEAEARVRGDFLWEVVSGVTTSEQEITTKAVLLGYPAQTRYRVVVAEPANGSGGSPGSGAMLDEAVNRTQPRLGLNEHVSRRGDQVLVVLNANTETERAHAVARSMEAVHGQNLVRWGIADDTYDMTALRRGFRRAYRALALGRALTTDNAVTEAEKVAPFMVLASLVDDEEAFTTAHELLRPLRGSDGAPARLLETLDVYLQQNGNISSAARALYLNRHSLMYRLRKIEELTGTSLNDHETRFLFELSLRLWKLRAHPLR